MKKQMFLIAFILSITISSTAITQTVQIGLSPGLSYVLGGSYYSDNLNMTFHEKSSVLLPFPERQMIQSLGLDIIPSYQIEFKVGLNHPAIFYLAQFEQKFLINTGAASLIPPPESSMAYFNDIEVKLSGSLLALNLGIGCRLQNRRATPYLDGMIIFTRIGDITVKNDEEEHKIDATINGKNRLGFGFNFGLEWKMSNKISIDTQLNLKNYVMWFREKDEDFFITTGLSAGLLYTLTSPNN